jgi:tetratricopeptide (TPR) repeat protein
MEMTFPLPDFLQRWLGSDSLVASVTYAALGLLVLLVLFVLWLRFGRGPRRRRAYRRALRFVRARKWHEALTQVERVKQVGRLSAAWQGRARYAEGEAHRVAGEAALEEKRYEESVEHLVASADLLNTNKSEARNRVIEAMLAEARRQFATTTDPETDAIHKLLARALDLQPAHAEALFWEALCRVRDGNPDQALAPLQTAREGVGTRVLDPAFYQGALLLRLGRPQEAVRYLAEAHRIEAESPLVAWQLGMALIAAKEAQATGQAPAAEAKTEVRFSELNLAIRALQRALGPQGLAQWLKTPQRVWVEGLPGQGRSYVRRLAAKHPFVCPVLGSDVAAMIRQGQVALAQAHYRMGNFQEAANVYTTVLREGAPSLPLLRGLGLALAWLGQYDQAFIQLRTVHEREEPGDPLTSAYLALCAAKGKPQRPEDKPSNVAWAVGLLAGLKPTPDPQWASLYTLIFEEARSIGLPVAAADQLRLCDVLAASHATDPRAAAAYDHLAATFPDAVRPEYALLYCRAAEQHGYRGERDLELYDRTFRESEAAKAYFAQRGWNFEDVEYVYLARCAARRPGAFPETLGPDYAPRGEALLLARSERQEQAGQADAALATADVLLQLMPRSALGHDRLARLAYRRGDLDRAITLLDAWHTLAPEDYRPLVRRAVIEHERGDAAASRAALDQALERVTGLARAAVAFLGAKLTLREWAQQAEEAKADGAAVPLSTCTELLHECLKADPSHTEALGCLAAVRSLLGDHEGLATQAGAMRRPEVKDARFHFLAALSLLEARDDHAAVEAATRAAADPSLAVESAYHMGRAFLRLDNMTAANLALQKVASSSSPSVDHARALLGRIGFARGAYDDAIRWWSALDPARCDAWRFDEALCGTVFLAGLAAFQAGRFEQAAERFREATRLELTDPRLGPLLTLALVKAGQHKLYARAAAPRGAATVAPGDVVVDVLPSEPIDTARLDAAIQLLDQGLQAGCKDPAVVYLLALAHKRRGNPREARSVLRSIDRPDANVLLQMGLLSLRELKPGVVGALHQAEQDFARAWQADPSSIAACYNLLLTRLSAGQLDQAAALLPRATALAPGPEEASLLSALQALLPAAQAPPDQAYTDPRLAELSGADEQRLLRVVRSLGQLDVVGTLLRALTQARPTSPAAQEAYLESLLVKGKDLLDRYDWVAAEKLLAPVEKARWSSRPMLAVLLNLRGCCACLAQDFEGGIVHFAAAAQQAGSDPRLQQNVALAHEWAGKLTQADPHWNRFLDLLDRRLPTPPGWIDYVQRLAYETLGRLATCYADKERWATALSYLERAHRLRPREGDVLERLFHLYVQLNRPDDARRVLRQLRDVRPNEPQNELYELSLLRVKSVNDLDRKLAELERIIRKFPHEPRVQDKAAEETGHLIGVMSNLYDQLTAQVGKVVNQVRHLPNSQVNWPAVADVMQEMRGDYQRLKRAVGKCQALAVTEDQRRALRDLGGKVDRKIEVCRSWGG